MNIHIGIIFLWIALTFYLTLPNETCTIKNEEEIQMYRRAVSQLEHELRKLSIRNQEQDVLLTTLKNSRRS